MKTIDRQHFIRKFGVLNFVLFLVAMASSVQVVAQHYHEPCDPELERKYNEEYLLDCGGLDSDIGPCGDAHLPQCIELADFIFEASVLKNEIVRGYEGFDDTYTLVYLEVTKTFKGNVKDTVVIIMKGGYMIHSKERGPSNTVPGQQFPIITPPKGFLGIFFTKKNEYHLLQPLN